MRRVNLGKPQAQDDETFRKWVMQAMAEIERASHEDLQAVAQAFTVTGFTDLRTLDAGTSTGANTRNFLCTFINDLKRRGSKRNQ